jgi:hypothetical protein
MLFTSALSKRYAVLKAEEKRRKEQNAKGSSRSTSSVSSSTSSSEVNFAEFAEGLTLTQAPPDSLLPSSSASTSASSTSSSSLSSEIDYEVFVASFDSPTPEQERSVGTEASPPLFPDDEQYMFIIETLPSAKLTVDAYWGMLSQGSRRSVMHAVRLDGSPETVTVQSMENLMANQDTAAALVVCELCGATGHVALDRKRKDKEKEV